jgi:hypothetical protein
MFGPSPLAPVSFLSSDLGVAYALLHIALVFSSYKQRPRGMLARLGMKFSVKYVPGKD